jgi:membrane-bound metal-dependent hydrolase YbcI (DUF457 family)
MFIGHYGVSFAAKRWAPQISLGTLFLAVQLLDVLFAIFVLVGIEKLRIVPGFTAYNPYDLYYMPYTHSLVGALAWSFVGGLIFLALRDRNAAMWIAAAVFSHFVLDVPMHTPDMPILGNDSPKIGLGLWHYRNLSLGAELIVLVAGLFIWRRGPTPGWGSMRAAGFALLLVVLTLATPFFPPPADATAFGWQALVGYLALAGVAGWLDRGRTST